MGNGARASARLTFCSDGALKMPARYRFARGSGVNAALRVQRKFVTHRREIQEETLDFELWTLNLYLRHGLDTLHHAAAWHGGA
jgi:hypothetical protein